jgi:PAS domain S-box-containing protein
VAEPAIESLDSSASPSAADFAAMAEHLPELAWIANPRGRIIWGNQRWRDYIGTSLEAVGATDWIAIHDPDYLPTVSQAWTAALKTGEPVEMAFPLKGADGAYKMFLTRAQPLRDGQGNVSYWFGINTDISPLQAATAALDEQRRTLETLNRTAAMVAGELNLEKLVQKVTDAAVALTGAKFGAFFYHVPQDDGEAMTLYTISGVAREEFDKFPMLRETAVFRPTFRGEGIVRSDDITADPRYGKNAPYNGMPPGHVPVRSYLAAPVVSRRGEIMGGLFLGHPEPARFAADHEILVIGLAAQAAAGIDNARLYESAQREIAERKQAEADRLLILRELNHRVKNLFAVAVGMIGMTARTATSPQQMATTLTGRLRALASAHDLIRPSVASENQGPHFTSVGALIERILAAHISSGQGQVTLDGPEILVGATGATSFALVLHEVATNAAKHGSLSLATGRVSIAWRIEERHMVLTWIERGGPPVTGPPARKGFGTDLAHMSARGQLGGEIRNEWPQEGVEITLRASLERLQA